MSFQTSASSSVRRAWCSASRTASSRSEQRLDRLDLEPAVDAPVAQRRVPPGVERRLELVDARHVEVGELRAQAAGVDDAVAEVPVLDRDVRDERGAHELRIRDPPTARR